MRQSPAVLPLPTVYRNVHRTNSSLETANMVFNLKNTSAVASMYFREDEKGFKARRCTRNAFLFEVATVTGSPCS